jgi:sulfotransferase
MKQLNICTGLPRTGSTVLMNILQQNPKIFTTATDPLPGIIHNKLLIDSRYTEPFQAMSTEQADNAVHGMVMGAVGGWYGGLTKKEIVVSKSRDWSGIYYLFPSSKILVTVRDLRDIVESFNKINRGIKSLHTYGDDKKLYPSFTESEKYNYHFKTSNALSGALHQELPVFMDLFQKTENKVKFIRYEDFLKNPEKVLESVYKFFNEPVFQHDLNNISQSELFEHDNAYFREKTSHKTKPQFVYWQEPKRNLSDEFQKTVIEEHKWYYEAFYPEVI